MNKLSICFEFKGGKGHAIVNILPGNIPSCRKEFSDCCDFTLSIGDYNLFIDGVSPSKGTSISIFVNQNEIISTDVEEGYFSKSFDVTIP